MKVLDRHVLDSADEMSLIYDTKIIETEVLITGYKITQGYNVLPRDVTRTLIGGGGGGGGGRGCIVIYSCSARRVSFQIDQFEFVLPGEFLFKLINLNLI